MNLVEALKNRKVQLGIAVVAILLAVALTLVWVLQPKNDNPNKADAPPAASTSGNADGTAVTSPDTTTPASPGACSATDEAGFVPVNYSIEKLGIEANVVSLGNDDEGNIEAPPKDEPKTAAWWNMGPTAGSNAGQVVLSIHTSADGRTACYQFTEAQKVDEATFDRESDVLERQSGDPALAIVICWDHNKETDKWDSRIFFKFKPVTDGA